MQQADRQARPMGASPMPGMYPPQPMSGQQQAGQQQQAGGPTGMQGAAGPMGMQGQAGRMGMMPPGGQFPGFPPQGYPGGPMMYPPFMGMQGPMGMQAGRGQQPSPYLPPWMQQQQQPQQALSQSGSPAPNASASPAPPAAALPPPVQHFENIAEVVPLVSQKTQQTTHIQQRADNKSRMQRNKTRHNHALFCAVS